MISMIFLLEGKFVEHLSVSMNKWLRKAARGGEKFILLNILYLFGRKFYFYQEK